MAVFFLLVREMSRPLPYNLKYRQTQAKWFQYCSWSHRLFCSCGDWIAHVNREAKGCLTTPATVWPRGKGLKDGGHVVDQFITKGFGDGFTAVPLELEENIDGYGRGLLGGLPIYMLEDGSLWVSMGHMLKETNN